MTRIILCSPALLALECAVPQHETRCAIAGNLPAGEPGGTADDARLATQEPDEYAWKLFLWINRQAKRGAAGEADPNFPTIANGDPDQDVVWETWALASRDGKPEAEVFLAKGAKPPAWEQLKRGGNAPKALDRNLTILGHLLPQTSGVQGDQIGPSFVVQEPESDEVRMNRGTFDFVRDQQLYNRESLATRFQDGKYIPLDQSNTEPHDDGFGLTFYQPSGPRDFLVHGISSGQHRQKEITMSLVAGVSPLTSLTAGQVPHQSDIEEYVIEQKKALHISGLSLAVVYKGSVYKNSWGNANEELSVPATADTVYELASMSKPLVATAAMLLMRDKKPPFALEDKVCKYLPEVPGAWGNITIRHLLSHLSGIKEYLLIPEFSTRREYSDGELLNMAARYPLNFSPGRQFDYTNTGYCILTMIIERTTRRPYGDILKERVFTPLGMSSTRVNDSTAIIPRRASGYSFRFGNRFHADFVARSQLAFGDCGVVSTLNDLLLLDKEMWKTDSTILPKDMLNQMWTPAKLNDGTPYQRYGLGWELYCDETGKVTEVYHGGAIEGFRSIILRYLGVQMTVIVLFNGELDEWVNDHFATDIADLVFGRTPGDHRAMRASIEKRHASLPRN